MNKTTKHRSGKHSPYTRPRKRKDVKDADKAEEMLHLNTRKGGGASMTTAFKNS